MKYILDASSIYKIAEANKLNIAESSITLDLAKYELGNAVLTDFTVLKRLDEAKANTLIMFLYELLDTIKQVKISEAEKVLKLASELKLSFYDASYAYCAKASNLTLITEDEKLKRKIKGHIKVISVKELA